MLSFLITIVALAAGSSQGGFTLEFFGEDINTTATDCNNEDAERIPHPNSDAAASAFRGSLQGTVSQGFEEFKPKSKVKVLNFGDDSATLTPPLTVLNVPDGTFNGVYPIKGDQFLFQDTGASKDSFVLEFSSPQVAFGFYMTDVEIVGNLTLRFVLDDGTTAIERPIRTEANHSCPQENVTGSVAFYGIIDTAHPFIRVEFDRPLNSDDGFGFDELVIANTKNAVPCPADINGSGSVTVDDLLQVINNWGPCPP